MDYLSNENLFFSKYIVGCEVPSNTNIDCVKTLHNWLYFKDNDYGMKRYRTDRTQYIAFLNIIDLPVLKEIINDLILIYKREYPFGEKSDFIEQIFKYTLYGLESFVEYDNYTFYGTPPSIKNEVYYKYTKYDNEFIDFVTEPSKDIEYYQQYYKKVIEIINNLDFENPQIKSKTQQQKQKKNLQNITDKIFTTNKKNYLALEKEYEFTENEGKFIYRNFWPIIVLNSFDAEWVKNQLDCYKTEFIKENKIFNLDIFKRNQTDFLISEINEYLDNLQKGKTKVWTERKGDYFHWFKLKFDTKSYTLLISDKNEVQLEIYFKTILAEISKFIENEQALSIQQIEAIPEQGNNEQFLPFKQAEQQAIIDTNKIIESGFIKAFISEYYEYKTHSYYPDKDRLLYVMCNSEKEKDKITEKKIKQTRLKIKKLGNEELSFAYVLSCKPESLHNFIELKERFDFWLNKFCEHFIYSINSFIPIIEACELFKDKLSDEDFENEFWEMFPISQKPKENCLPFVIQRESELLNEIEYTISEYKENEYWEFDFNEIEKYIDISKPIENLFNISELLVQLNRFEMFKSLLFENQQPKTNPEVVIKEYIPKPCFTPESINVITKDLNAFFEVNQHAELKKIIETGSNANEKLLFRDNGNRLTDYFGRLYKEDTITGCNKKELINWIVKNFKYTSRKIQKDFITKTVERTISGTEQPCKNPII